MFTALFWATLLVILYVYAIYPFCAKILSMVRRRDVNKRYIEPSVSILIAAHNEEGCIRSTIENKLALDYPMDKLEVIVISDASMDRTDEIVREYGGRGVRLLRQDFRQGKTAALNRAALIARGEVIVFSDANSIYARNALRELLSNFADESVGYVTGSMRYMARGDRTGVGVGCSLYMKYENLVRTIETRLNSVVGVDGGLDAIRRGLYVPMKAEQLPDLVLPLRVIEQGYRVVYEPAAILKENSLSAAGDEYRMRVRVSLRALHAINDMRHLLNPFRFGIYSWQLFSHKVLRYCIFLLLVELYMVNSAIFMTHGLYTAAYLAQNVFYMAAALGYWLDRNRTSICLFRIPFYFCLLNMAAAHAAWRFINHEKAVVWTPRSG